MSESRWNGWQDDAETGGSANLSKDGSEALYSQNPASDRQACNGNHMHFWSDGEVTHKSQMVVMLAELTKMLQRQLQPF